MSTPLLSIAPPILPTGARVARQLPASLQGTVIDAAGKPVSNAIVYAFPQDSRRQIRTIADQHGRFLFKALPEGAIYVDAFRKADGFPCNFFAFFSRSHSTSNKVELKAGNPPQDIVINLVHEVARIVINVTDQNGTPIKGLMAMSFIREDMPGAYRQAATAPFSMLVPTAPFSFSVEVEGFQRWLSEQISIQPGETLDFAVKLQTK